MRSAQVGPFAGAGDGGPTIALAMTTAAARTKLSEFGSLEFVANYDILLTSNEWKKTQANLTPLGYLLVQEMLTESIVRRLLFEDYRKRASLLLTDIPVREPVFVLGLPRTGTTLLHRLLSLDNAKFRAPLLWELLHPVPKVAPNALPHEHATDRQARLAFAKGRLAQAEALGLLSRTQHIHEMGPELPEECLGLLTDCVPMHAFCFYHLTTLPTTSEAMLSGYQSYRRYLQLLSLQTGEAQTPRQWMLKCPLHLTHARSIAAIFPGAKLIWTHRELQQCIPSVCSLIVGIHETYHKQGSLPASEVGLSALSWAEKCLQHAPQDIAASGLDCLDVTYANLVANPVETVRAIYAQFGWHMSLEYTAALEAYLAQNRRDREALAAEQRRAKEQRGRGGGGGAAAAEGSGHVYSLAEFGIDERELKRGAFAEYTRTYLTHVAPLSAPPSLPPSLPASLPASLPDPPSPPSPPRLRASASVSPEPKEQGEDGVGETESGGEGEGEAGGGLMPGSDGGRSREPKFRRNTSAFAPKRATGDCVGAATGTGRERGAKCHAEA